MNTLIVATAQYAIYPAALIALGLWLTLPKSKKLTFVVVFVLAGVFAIGLSLGIAHFYFDVRPFVRQHKDPLFTHVADNGFPSDHTTLTMLAALTCASFSRIVGAVLAVCSLAIGTARVAALVHSPIDIVGSICIAFVSFGLAVRLAPLVPLKIAEETKAD